MAQLHAYVAVFEHRVGQLVILAHAKARVAVERTTTVEGEFVQCSAALHHALTAFGQPRITDDARDFKPAPPAAAWQQLVA